MPDMSENLAACYAPQASARPSVKPYFQYMAKKGGHMRILKLAAITGLGALALASGSFAATGSLKTGVSAQTSLLDNDAYGPGMGVNGYITAERAKGYGVGGLGLRANFDNYRVDEGLEGKDIQEGGVALTALGGPNTARIQPRIGGHVGYTRMEGGNYLDFGPDVMANFVLTPKLGVHALVTPTWLTDDDATEYLGTKMGLGVTWSVPGA